jgi:hypothetical protein
LLTGLSKTALQRQKQNVGEQKFSGAYDNVSIRISYLLLSLNFSLLPNYPLKKIKKATQHKAYAGGPSVISTKLS